MPSAGFAGQFIGGIPYGSYVILSAGQLEGHAGEQFTAEYRAAKHGLDVFTAIYDALAGDCWIPPIPADARTAP